MQPLRHIRAESLDPRTAQTAGMSRLAAITAASAGSNGIWMGQTHVAPGTRSADHHHGESETAIFVLAGHPAFVYLDGGVETRISTSPGDYVYVPPYTPHREENPSDTRGGAGRHCPQHPGSDRCQPAWPHALNSRSGPHPPRIFRVLALLNVTHLVETSGYAAIFILSVLQSCCVPTSSELTMGFAGVLASQGKLSLPAVILVGATGETVGAYIAWFIGRYGGRGFVDRYGKYVLLTHHDLDRAEGWYDRHGNWGVFGGRLIPVVRNFVALPAGVAEFPLVRFGVLTFLGSLIWDGSMALIGYGVGGSYHKIMKGFAYAGYVLLAGAVVAIAVVVYHRYQAYKAATAAGGARRPTSRAGDDRPSSGEPARVVEGAADGGADG